MHNLMLRFLTSIVLLPLVISATLAGGIFLALLLTLVAVLCSYEVALMVMPKSRGTLLRTTLLSLALISPLLLLGQTPLIIPTWSIIVFIINLIFLFSPHIDSRNLERISTVFYFTLYTSLSIASLYWLRIGTKNLSEEAGISFILLACLATWGNDTFAYFGGRFLGKNPLFKRVSAKKTWEGFIAGACGSAFLIALLYALLPQTGLNIFAGLTWLDCAAITLPAMILAPLGDLIESRLKRVYEVKDSSQLLPGHGGILDRIDGLLVVLPWTALYAFFIRPLW